MRRLSLAVVILATAWGLASPARAEGPWYVSGSVGGYFRENDGGSTTITNRIITAPGTNARSFDPGVAANVAIGHRLPRHFRIELEAGYLNDQISTVNPASSRFPTLNGQTFNRQTGGDVTHYIGTVNVFFDFPPALENWLVPYVGGGIGGAHIEFTQALFVDANGNRFKEFGGQSTHGVVQVEGGVSISLGDGIAVVPAYRYIRFFANSPTFGNEVAHIAKLGLRYSF